MKYIQRMMFVVVFLHPNLAMGTSYGEPLPSVEASSLASHMLLNIAIGLYVLAFAFSLAIVFTTKKNLVTLGWSVTLIAIALHVLGYLLRWKELYDHGWGRFPLSSFYEALILYGLMLAATCSFLQKKSQREIVAVFSLPLVIAVLLFANGTRFTGISALYTSGYDIELSMFIYRVGVVKLLLLTAGYCLMTTAGVASSLLAASKILARKSLSDTFFPPTETLYEWNKKAIIGGSVLFTLGFMVSLFWSEIAWGTYWAWDPSETLLALTFIIYTILILKNAWQGWSAIKSTNRSIIGLCVIVVAYFIARHLLRAI